MSMISTMIIICLGGRFDDDDYNDDNNANDNDDNAGMLPALGWKEN